MAKTMVVTCDSCDKDIAKEPYMVLTIHAVKAGVKSRMPTVYLCRECYKRIPLSVMMFGTSDKSDKSEV